MKEVDRRTTSITTTHKRTTKNEKAEITSIGNERRDHRQLKEKE